MFAAVDLGIADDRERAGHKQAAEITIALFADTTEPVLAPARIGTKPIQAEKFLIGKPLGQRHSPPERLPAMDRHRECSEAACRSFCQQSILRRASCGAMEHYVLVALLNQHRVVAFLLFPLPCHLLKPNSVRQMGPRSISS